MTIDTSYKVDYFLVLTLHLDIFSTGTIGIFHFDGSAAVFEAISRNPGELILPVDCPWQSVGFFWEFWISINLIGASSL